MRRIIYMLLIGGFMSAVGMARAEEPQEAPADSVVVNVGDAAPVFQATADNGKLWKSADHVGKKTLIVYFFPAAMTGG